MTHGADTTGVTSTWSTRIAFFAPPFFASAIGRSMTGSRRFSFRGDVVPGGVLAGEDAEAQTL